MSNFLGLFLSWPVLVSIAAVVGLIFVLNRYLVNKPKLVSAITSVLEHASKLIMRFTPDKYEDVYKAVMAAVSRVVDGNFTQDEALITAREVFKATLATLNVELTDDEKEFVDDILVFIIEMISKDVPAATVAVASVCAVKNYSF